MNKKILQLKLIIGILIFTFVNCGKPNSKKEGKKIADSEKTEKVMTKEMQEKLTPEEALNDLIRGNSRYTSNKLTNWNLSKQITSTTKGQYPKAVILACIDSRVPVEYIFDQGIGDVFVVRVAGNIEDKALLGSMEYGLGVAGSKLLMVLGHENCGAVKSAIKKVDVGSENITSLLNEIEPAIQETKGERNEKNKIYFETVVKNNVQKTIKDIKSRSPLISKLEKEKKIKIVGAYYSLTDGKVTVINENKN